MNKTQKAREAVSEEKVLGTFWELMLKYCKSEPQSHCEASTVKLELLSAALDKFGATKYTGTIRKTRTELCKCLLCPECPQSGLTYLPVKFSSSHLKKSVFPEGK